jgi:hypothetical protein
MTQQPQQMTWITETHTKGDTVINFINLNFKTSNINNFKTSFRN